MTKVNSRSVKEDTSHIAQYLSPIVIFSCPQTETQSSRFDARILCMSLSAYNCNCSRFNSGASSLRELPAQERFRTVRNSAVPKTFATEVVKGRQSNVHRLDVSKSQIEFKAAKMR